MEDVSLCARNFLFAYRPSTRCRDHVEYDLRPMLDALEHFVEVE